MTDKVISLDLSNYCNQRFEISLSIREAPSSEQGERLITEVGDEKLSRTLQILPSPSKPTTSSRYGSNSVISPLARRLKLSESTSKQQIDSESTYLDKGNDEAVINHADNCTDTFSEREQLLNKEWDHKSIDKNNNDKHDAPAYISQNDVLNFPWIDGGMDSRMQSQQSLSVPLSILQSNQLSKPPSDNRSDSTSEPAVKRYDKGGVKEIIHAASDAVDSYNPDDSDCYADDFDDEPSNSNPNSNSNPKSNSNPNSEPNSNPNSRVPLGITDGESNYSPTQSQAHLASATTITASRSGDSYEDDFEDEQSRKNSMSSIRVPLIAKSSTTNHSQSKALLAIADALTEGAVKLTKTLGTKIVDHPTKRDSNHDDNQNQNYSPVSSTAETLQQVIPIRTRNVDDRERNSDHNRERNPGHDRERNPDHRHGSQHQKHQSQYQSPTLSTSRSPKRHYIDPQTDHPNSNPNSNFNHQTEERHQMEVKPSRYEEMKLFNIFSVTDLALRKRTKTDLEPELEEEERIEGLKSGGSSWSTNSDQEDRRREELIAKRGRKKKILDRREAAKIHSIKSGSNNNYIKPNPNPNHVKPHTAPERLPSHTQNVRSAAKGYLTLTPKKNSSNKKDRERKKSDYGGIDYESDYESEGKETLPVLLRNDQQRTEDEAKAQKVERELALFRRTRGNEPLFAGIRALTLTTPAVEVHRSVLSGSARYMPYSLQKEAPKPKRTIRPPSIAVDSISSSGITSNLNPNPNPAIVSEKQIHVRDNTFTEKKRIQFKKRKKKRPAVIVDRTSIAVNRIRPDSLMKERRELERLKIFNEENGDLDYDDWTEDGIDFNDTLSSSITQIEEKEE